MIPYALTWVAHLFAIQRRRWKYWKLSQEWVIIAAWVQAGPQSQNNSVGWNVLWKQTWTLSGTGRLFIPQIRPLLLQAAWHSNAPYFINSLWINNTDSDKSYWSMSGCVYMLCVCVSVHVLYVCDKCYICDRAAWSSPWEAAALFNDWTVFSSPYLPSSSPSVYLSVSVSPSSPSLSFAVRFDFLLLSPSPPSLSGTWWDAQIVNKKHTVPPQTYWSHTHQSDGKNRLWLMPTKGRDAFDRVCELLCVCFCDVCTFPTGPNTFCGIFTPRVDW